MNIKNLLAGIQDSEISINIKGIALNANKIKQDYAFFALQGSNNHGSEYIEQAINNGCCVIVSENKNIECSLPCITVKNLSEHLKTIANRFYQDAKLVRLIGITGTNGKTSVSIFISQILEKLGVKTGIIGTLGIKDSEDKTTNTTPDILSIYKALDIYYKNNTKIVIMEVSSHALDQNRTDGLFFEQAIFTNLSQDHLDYHKNMENYRSAKTKLFSKDKTKYAIINKDDKNYNYFLDSANAVEQSLFSIDELEYFHIKNEGFLCMLDNFIFEIPLIGKFNLSNILATIKSLTKLGYTKEQILLNINAIKAPTGRMQKLAGYNIWIDYAHTPDALSCAMQSLSEHYKNAKIKIIFGCGGDRDTDKRARMGQIASKFASDIILTNDNPRNEDQNKIISEIESGINGNNYKIITDRKLAIETAVKSLQEDECLLIAGKGHEQVQLIGNNTIYFEDLEVVKNALMW